MNSSLLTATLLKASADINPGRPASEKIMSGGVEINRATGLPFGYSPGQALPAASGPQVRQAARQSVQRQQAARQSVQRQQAAWKPQIAQVTSAPKPQSPAKPALPPVAAKAWAAPPAPPAGAAGPVGVPGVRLPSAPAFYPSLEEEWQKERDREQRYNAVQSRLITEDDLLQAARGRQISPTAHWGLTTGGQQLTRDSLKDRGSFTSPLTYDNYRSQGWKAIGRPTRRAYGVGARR